MTLERIHEAQEAGGLMEDSMFDEQFVTTAEEIKEAREALIEFGKDIARRGNEVELWQAQIAYTQMFAKMGPSKPGDDGVSKEDEAATSGCSHCSRKGGRLRTDCCSAAIGSSRRGWCTTTGWKAKA
jgi:hypothetical protein